MVIRPCLADVTVTDSFTTAAPIERYPVRMNIRLQLQVLEHEHALDAVQARLMVAAATLAGASDGFAPIKPATLKRLAVELRAIGLGLDALRVEPPPPTPAPVLPRRGRQALAPAAK